MDLFILAADRTIETVLDAVIKRLVQRSERGGIREIEYKIKTAIYHDGNLRRWAVELLRQENILGSYNRCMIVLDYEGSGSDLSCDALAGEMKESLIRNGWSEANIEIIILYPEIEEWLWKDRRRLADILRMDDDLFREKLNTLEFNDSGKPVRPKEDFETLCKIQRKPRSRAVYKSLADTVSLENCQSSSFLLFRSTLEKWFSNEGF